VGTHGHLALRGVKQFGLPSTRSGSWARSAEDVQLIRGLLLSGSPAPDGHRVTRPARIAVLAEPVAADLAPSMSGAIGWAVDAVADAGMEVTRRISPQLIDELISLHEVVMAFETARTLAREFEHASRLSDELRQFLEQGWASSRPGIVRPCTASPR
jgi:hypothetical protein